MSLTELISGVESHERTLTVYNAADAVEDLRDRFADRNLVVEAVETETGPERFLVLSHDGEFLTAVGVDELLSDPEPTSAGFGGDPYQPILDHIDETLFTSYDRGEMLAASREIEDRAWRVGAGELHAGFQRISTLESQLDTYSALGSLEALSVHTYASADTEVPAQTDFLIHADDAEEITASWFVAFDGAGLDHAKCALLAEERSPGEFYGFWSYDPDTVEYVIEHLRSTYVHADDGVSERRQ
ncbi:DICT sensory domain-containing protein [Halalkalicoccus jeotgali]|uniref:DICT domain-containing protein n=1 Tax=Halalkalicoccus jeotgali (strain DSM 18796 / CECT 7217 / JCM 14584 / KCTC 4019 / B3) TaxID=795797 RepID=D8J2P9_HALJB|nr:DICT sensory domain-containing protein [Halalkalicoccus jeotgali]ADJ15006.1 hypothetical protein HacjB3_08105 [Halalkalicoccus jeotgali B3]ELY34978.1 hypothetical protein C497_14617 [Halalkalicoccus jeotgali B3]